MLGDVTFAPFHLHGSEWIVGNQRTFARQIIKYLDIARNASQTTGQ